ncbi:MAG: hypothetical protein CL610_26935 [Anaerolineaceae bacterium]|nr:hypothetical protein [Anaerolineaceae bacterium]
MFPQDKLIVQAAIDRNRRNELIEVIERHPDLFTEVQIMAPPAPPYPHKSIFINYRRNDSEDVVGRIYDRLSAEFGKGGVFKDVEDILPGVDFRRVLEHEVSCTDVLLAVIGPDWLNRTNKRRLADPNDFVRFEIETALARDIPVIPMLVGRRERLPQARHLPASLRPLIYRNAVQVRPDPDFHHDINRLIEGITALFELNPEPIATR